jgi:hypothetical protein
MTSIDAMTALLHDDLAAAMIMRATSNNNDYATFRINYDIMRIANRELTDELAAREFATIDDLAAFIADLAHKTS